MSLPESCPGCQRPVIDVRGPVHACEDGANGTAQRCAWRSLRQQASLTSAPWPDAAPREPERATAGAKPPMPPRPAQPAPSASPASAATSTSSATSSADPLADARQQVADEQAARRALRDQLRTAEAIAAEAQAVRAGLFDELERTRAELARARSAAAAVGANGVHAATASAASGTTARPTGPILVDPASLAPPSMASSSPSGSGRGAPPSSTAGSSSDAGPIHGPRGPRGTPRRASLQLGLLAIGAVVGIALGAAGVEWLRTSSEPPLAMQMDETPPASQAVASSGDATRASAPSLAQAQSAAQAADAAATVATAESASAAAARSSGSASTASQSAADLRARLQTALAAEGVANAVDVAPDTAKVTVADPAADRATRARTDVIIRAVYAGAQLPEPSIEHRWISQSSAERVASARRRHGGEDPIMAAANAHRDDDLMTLGAPAAGRRASTAAEGATPGVTSATAGAHPPVLPAGRITASCNEKTAHASLLSQSWVMWGCMRSKCCASASAEHSEECAAYSRSYPLTCPR